MDQHFISSNQVSVITKIKDISAFGVGITALCFVLGVLIVNIHHAQYGLYSNELLRTEYVFSGAILLLLIAIAEINFTYIRLRATEIKVACNSHQYSSCIKPSVGIAISISMVPFAFTVLTFQNWTSVHSLIDPVLGILVVWSIAFQTLSNPSWNKAIKTFTTPSEYNEKARIESLRNLIMPTFVLFVGIATYSSLTYQHISAAFGGGHRNPLLLFPNTKGIEISKTLALPIRSDKAVGPVEVITETDSELIILVPDELSGKKVAVRLNKQLFDAIQTKSIYHYGKTS